MAKVNFTARRVQEHFCPDGRAQAFLWDAGAPGLGLRATIGGAKSYIFQAKLDGLALRLTIGDPRSWTIDQAQEEARRLQRLIDEGKDPRKVKAQARADRQAKATADVNESVTVGAAWNAYLDDRRRHWGQRHYLDHLSKAKPGGEPAVRGTRGRGVTEPGPLYPLMVMKLRDLSAPTIEAWASSEVLRRPTSARLAWRLLKGFLAWCTEHPVYSTVVITNAAKTRRTREVLGSDGVKQDVLQREQLAAWFSAVHQLPNPVTAAYLQILLLTGARPGEVLELRWVDVNTKWKGLTIRDKVDGERTIPLTPYVAHLLGTLPRRSEWAFATHINIVGKPPRPISKPHQMHERACRVAGIEGLTLHGLRRSFKSLTEWLECPAGVVAQIMGHKPSATAEKHYTVRPLDLLRVHHERIEEWILKQAKIQFLQQQEKPGLTKIGG